MRHMKECPKRAAHAVDQGHAAVGKRHPALHRRQHHAFPSSSIVRLAPRGLQMARDIFDARERERIGQRIRLPRHIGFDAVGERVDSTAAVSGAGIERVSSKSTSATLGTR